MEDFLVHSFKFIVVSFLTYYLISPVIHNHKYFAKNTWPVLIYKVCAAVLTFTVIFLMYDMVFDFKNEPHILNLLSFLSLVYCISFWLTKEFTYDPQ